MIRNQKGFTLIEIIAVLVILGILAAVAIPKFFDLQNEAKLKNAQAAVASAQSAMSMGYASYLLNAAGASAGNYTNPADACTTVKTDAPSGVTFTVNCTGNTWAGNATINATYDGVSATGSWTKP